MEKGKVELTVDKASSCFDIRAVDVSVLYSTFWNNR